MSLAAILFYLDESDLTGNDKLAMIVLADYADDRGQCYPGQARIAYRLRMTEPAARKVLYRLRELGELSIEQSRGVVTGTGPTNRYTLTKFAARKGDPYGSPLNLQQDCKGDPYGSPFVTKGDPYGSPQGDPYGSPIPQLDPLDNIVRARTDDSRGESSTVKAKRTRSRTRAVDPNAGKPLTPTPSPAKAKRPRKTSNPALADALWETYQASMAQHEPGAALDVGKERKALNQLADAGTWTPDHLAQCIDAMKADQFWKGQHLSAASIKTQIAAKLAGKVTVQTNGTNGHSKAPARPSLEQWLFDTYGMDNLTIIAMTTGKSKDDIEMEYQLA